MNLQKLKSKLFYPSIILLYLSLTNGSCKDLYTENPDTEAYVLTGAQENTIATEFPEYEFIPFEEREIMVYGNDEDGVCSFLWVDDGNNKYIGNGANHYSSGANFVVPLSIRAPENLGTYTYTIHAGKEENGSRVSKRQCQVTIRVVYERNFTIRYNCMTGYDILNDIGNIQSYDVKKQQKMFT